jgi:hypothetical protein
MTSSSSKVIIRLSGGLGNQMFQYAFGRALAGERRLLFDTGSFQGDALREFRLDCFDLGFELTRTPSVVRLVQGIPGIGRFMRLVGGRIGFPGFHIVWDRMKGIDKGIVGIPGSIHAIGYWQDLRYFKSIEDEIRSAFTPNHEFHEETRNMFDVAPDAIGIQVRRGDYSNRHVALMHPPPPPSYYAEAVGRLAERHGIATAILCSDDLDWSKRNIELPVEQVIYRNSKVEEWEDLFLLARCAHVVISNSSFGWWSAWLGESSDRQVICPEYWFGPRGKSFTHPGIDEWEYLSYENSDGIAPHATLL